MLTRRLLKQCILHSYLLLFSLPVVFVLLRDVLPYRQGKERDAVSRPLRAQRNSTSDLSVEVPVQQPPGLLPTTAGTKNGEVEGALSSKQADLDFSSAAALSGEAGPGPGIGGLRGDEHLNLQSRPHLLNGEASGPILVDQIELFLQPKDIPLPTRNECRSFIFQQPSNNGLGHSHADRNNALLVALRFDPSFKLCFAYSPLGSSHHQSGEIFEKFFNFSHHFVSVAELQNSGDAYRWIRVKAAKVSQIIQEIKRRWHPRTVYNIVAEMQVNHCPSIPIWRNLYWRQRDLDPVPPVTASECIVIAIHVRPHPFPSAKRELPPEYYSVAANKAKSLIQSVSSKPVCIFLHTAPGRFNYSELAAQVEGLHVRLNDSVTDVFHYDAVADVLVTSKSGFDHTNAMFGKRSQLRLCAPMWLTTNCDDTWITTTKTGDFDAAHFLRTWRLLHPETGAVRMPLPDDFRKGRLHLLPEPMPTAANTGKASDVEFSEIATGANRTTLP
eukprot:NODE_1029_length_1753_cov_33.077465_g907_i0.p1 GENE.NODE_1029_length_1753_cov_33.077465_g907_i0~~NODE_1029_length_1753_cov_33.077465_g907_i0.p1  ORF type:complete len:499 (+),score=68.04 NODE_1029_length_1753_cov_33.077465_g907_i0:119-1615(+)